MLSLPMHVCVSSVRNVRYLMESEAYKPASYPIVYAASIFLATKVQETPQRVRDVINAVFWNSKITHIYFI